MVKNNTHGPAILGCWMIPTTQQCPPKAIGPPVWIFVKQRRCCPHRYRPTTDRFLYLWYDWGCSCRRCTTMLLTQTTQIQCSIQKGHEMVSPLKNPPLLCSHRNELGVGHRSPRRGVEHLQWPSPTQLFPEVRLNSLQVHWFCELKWGRCWYRQEEWTIECVRHAGETTTFRTPLQQIDPIKCTCRAPSAKTWTTRNGPPCLKFSKASEKSLHLMCCLQTDSFAVLQTLVLPHRKRGPLSQNTSWQSQGCIVLANPTCCWADVFRAGRTSPIGRTK